MRARIESVIVLGLGKVGILAATLLHETGFQVKGVDKKNLTGCPRCVYS